MTYAEVGGVSALNSNYIIFQLNLLLAHADSAGHPISACPATTKFPQSLCVLWIIEQIPTKSRGGFNITNRVNASLFCQSKMRVNTLE